MSPRRLADLPVTDNFLSKAACQALFDRIVALGTGGGRTSVAIVSSWRGVSTWARNRVYVSQDVRETQLSITRAVRGAEGRVVTSRLDDDGVREAVREAERTMRTANESPEPRPVQPVSADTPHPTLWSTRSAALSADERAELARRMIAPAESEKFLSAGEIVVGAQGRATFTTEGVVRYYPITTVEASASVRDPKRGASGWAGVTDFDLARVDTAMLASRALEKARGSANPVAIEPGRYTTILEPQAVADLYLNILTSDVMTRPLAESGYGPFASPQGGSKISERVLDPRLMMRADPLDPDGAFTPFDVMSGEAYRAVNWIDQGILRQLDYRRDYALGALGLDKALLNSKSYRLAGVAGVPVVSMDEMIRTTTRGLLVTRLANIEVIDVMSMLLGGFTRDGVWLIENGKISKPVKNFRFTESPMFAFNNVAQIGTPVRVFDRERSVVVPPIKVIDFSMTALADAV